MDSGKECRPLMAAKSYRQEEPKEEKNFRSQMNRNIKNKPKIYTTITYSENEPVPEAWFVFFYFSGNSFRYAANNYLCRKITNRWYEFN